MPTDNDKPVCVTGGVCVCSRVCVHRQGGVLQQQQFPLCRNTAQLAAEQ